MGARRPLSAARMLTPEIARWLRDDVLPQLGYNGQPDELRVALARHDLAVEQLTGFVAEEHPPS